MDNQALTRSSVIVQGRGLLSSNVYGDVVLIGLKSGFYYDLDEVGSFIWNAIEKPASVADVIEKILIEYEIDRSVCEKEVMEFLEDLQVYNLLVIK